MPEPMRTSTFRLINTTLLRCGTRSSTSSKNIKNEILRIAKEFLYNDYEKKYQVCIETIVGALSCEEKRDEYLNIFYKLKKEYKDNLKKIEFFCKFKTNIPK